jgi:hypothetical protein
MQSKKNALDLILDQVRAAAPELGEPQLQQIALGIQRDLGGTRHYLPKAPAWGKALCLGGQLAAGVPLAQAFAAVGVSKRYGFKLARRRVRRLGRF